MYTVGPTLQNCTLNAVHNVYPLSTDHFRAGEINTGEIGDSARYGLLPGEVITTSEAQSDAYQLHRRRGNACIRPTFITLATSTTNTRDVGCASIAELVYHPTRNRKLPGSNPTPTFACFSPFFILLNRNWKLPFLFLLVPRHSIPHPTPPY